MTRRHGRSIGNWVFQTMVTLLCGLVATACVASFEERHYFKSLSVDDESKRPNNYFRLTVDGFASFSSARYVSGYYDERAVDLFFNEIKISPGNDRKMPALFESEPREPGSNEVISPLSPISDHGALVMILSTNASAVASAIGSFAESQVVASAITNLINQDTIREARLANAKQAVQTAEIQAFATELETLFRKLDASNKDAFSRGYLRILTVIADALEPGTHFATMDEAEIWFRNRPRG